MKSVLIAVAAVVLVAMPGVIYWNISEDFASVSISSTVTFEDGSMSSAQESCEEVTYEEDPVSCYESTSVESHTTLERVVRGLLYSLILGLIPLWALVSIVDYLTQRKKRR